MIDNRIKQAINNYIDVQREYNNVGMFSKQINKNVIRLLYSNHIRVFYEKGIIEQNGRTIATITKRYASRKKNGCYKELKPIINYI